MSDLSGYQKRMNRLYGTPQESVYNHVFLQELSSGYSFILGVRSERRDFFSFVPKACPVSNLLKGKQHYDISYDIEQVINSITYSLMEYGKAYVYIKPEYTKNAISENNEDKVLSKIQIGEIKGFVKKRNKTNITFCIKRFDETISELAMKSNQLIEFDIKDTGYDKKYFVNILKRLKKCDITQSSTFMVNNNLDGYDYEVHAQKNRLRELKILKTTGWLHSTEGLSDSYILFKRIQEEQLRIRFLNYILDRLNSGFASFVGKDCGKLIAHIVEKDYEKLWKDYSDGKITGSQLSDILYNKT